MGFHFCSGPGWAREGSGGVWTGLRGWACLGHVLSSTYSTAKGRVGSRAEEISGSILCTAIPLSPKPHKP